MITPDRWLHCPPWTWQASRAELMDFLEVAARNPAAFREWELNFCTAARLRMKRGKLSFRMLRILDNGLLERLWRNDPSLWD